MAGTITITPTADAEGNIYLKLSSTQFDEMNKALVAHNKRRELHRNVMAKRRGKDDPKQCKPTLILSYPVAQKALKLVLRRNDSVSPPQSPLTP